MTTDNDRILVVPQDRVRNKPCPETASADLWEMTVLRRNGLPPLRFKGQRRAKLVHVASPCVSLGIELWMRQRGGYALAYSDVGTGKPQPQAYVFAHLHDVTEHLEALCSDRLLTSRQPDIATALSEILLAASFQQHFAILVGDFLAAIDGFAEQVPSNLSLEET